MTCTGQRMYGLRPTTSTRSGNSSAPTNNAAKRTRVSHATSRRSCADAQLAAAIRGQPGGLRVQSRRPEELRSGTRGGTSVAETSSVARRSGVFAFLGTTYGRARERLEVPSLKGAGWRPPVRRGCRFADRRCTGSACTSGLVALAIGDPGRVKMAASTGILGRLVLPRRGRGPRRTWLSFGSEQGFLPNRPLRATVIFYPAILLVLRQQAIVRRREIGDRIWKSSTSG